MNLDIFNLVIISGVIQGFIFTAVILLNERYRSATSRYIAYVVLFLSLSNLQYWCIENNIMNTRYIFVPWQWLIMPMFYVFVLRFLTERKISNNVKVLLFGPFFLILIAHVTQILIAKNTSYQIPSHYERGFFLYLDYCSFFFNFSIVFAAYRKIKKFQYRPKEEKAMHKIQTDWLLRLLYIGFFICVFWFVALSITLYLNKPDKSFFYILWLSISFLVYWLGYAAVYQLKVYKERLHINATVGKTKEKEKTKKEPPILQKIIKLINEDTLYLNPNLKQKDITDELRITTGYLSKVFNEEQKTSFTDYINGLRIEHAKKLLVHKSFANYTHVSIGLESGFNSKSTFFKAFKKQTGMTPQQYKDRTHE